MGSAKFLIGIGVGSAIGALACRFSRTAKAKQLKIEVINVLHEMETDAESTWLTAKEKAMRTGSKMAGKVADKATEVKEKLDRK